MKKIAAIFFILIFLFNWFGYRLLIDYMQQRHNQRFEAMLDRNKYNENELISIKVPFRIPYFSNSNRFERVDGEINMDGIRYKYVKRRFYKDTMELMCIPYYAGMRLEKAGENFYKLVNDLQSHDQSAKSNSKVPVIKNIVSDYFKNNNNWELNESAQYELVHHSSYLFYTPDFVPGTKGQPPELA